MWLLFFLMRYIVLHDAHLGHHVSFSGSVFDPYLLVQGVKVFFITHTINVLFFIFVYDFILKKILHKEIPDIVFQIISVIVYITAILLIASNVSSKSVATMFTAMGGIGIMIGLGIQRLILDAFSGLALNMDRAFKIGDYIEIQNGSRSYAGNIVKLGWRFVTIVDEGEYLFVVPNSILSGSVVISYVSSNRISELEAVYYFHPNESYNLVSEIINNAFASVAARGYILKDPVHLVRFSRIEPERGMRIKIYYYGEDVFKRPPKFSASKLRNFVNAAVSRHITSAGMLFYDSNEKIKQTNKYRLDEKEVCFNLINNLPLLYGLEPEEKEYVSNRMKIKFYSKGMNIIEEGDEGDSLFILRKGFCSIKIHNEKEEKVVAIMDPGDFFGEMSLLLGEKRSATVVAETDVAFYEIKKEDFSHLLNSNERLYETFARFALSRVQLNKDTLRKSNLPQEEKHHLHLAEITQRIKSFFTQ